jgi:hypothetical protein
MSRDWKFAGEIVAIFDQRETCSTDFIVSSRPMWLASPAKE